MSSFFQHGFHEDKMKKNVTQKSKFITVVITHESEQVNISEV
jgi:hypothetical protein